MHQNTDYYKRTGAASLNKKKLFIERIKNPQKNKDHLHYHTVQSNSKAYHINTNTKIIFTIVIFATQKLIQLDIKVDI